MVALQFEVLAGISGKINNQVRTLAWSQRQKSHRDWRRQQPLIRTDLLEFELIRERQMEESPVGGIENSQAVRAWLHFTVRRDFSVHEHSIAKDFGHPG